MNRSYPVRGLSWQEENLGRKKRMDKGETIRSLRNGKIRQPRIGKGLLTGMEREKLEQKDYEGMAMGHDMVSFLF